MHGPRPDRHAENNSFLTRHLEETGEGYGEHLLFTLRIGLAFVCRRRLVVIIHGLLPFILERQPAVA